MSVTRYKVEELECCFQADMIESPTGEYVLHSDYARLKAEVDEARRVSGAGMKVMLGLSDDLVAENARLKAEVEAHEKRWAESEDLISHYKQQRDEAINDCKCSRLKAEVERLDDLCKQLMAQHSDISCENIMLRKAGDAMEQEVIGCYFEQDDPADSESLRAWRAAKEGKLTK